MRDIRTKNWFWIENELVDRIVLSFEEKAMYMILARFVDKEGKCFPSIEKLSEIIGKDKRTVIRYMKKLEEKGLVEKKRRYNQTNVYCLKNVTSNSDKNDNDKNDSDKDVTSLGDTSVTSNSDKNVNLTKHIEQYPINNTQIKEKNKKGNVTENLLDYIETLEIDSEKKKIFKEWVEYKKEKNQYKNTKSLDILIKRFIKYSVQELRDIVEKSIMNNYSGIFEPKVNNSSSQEKNNEISKMTPEERERMIKAKYFGGA